MNIFSFIVSILVVLWFIYSKFLYRISFGWSRKFGSKQIIGIEIWFWNKYKDYATNYGFDWSSDN